MIRIRHFWPITLSLAGLLAWATAGICTEQPTATLTAAALREGIAETQAKIRSIRIEYTAADYDEVRFAPGFYLHRVITCKAPDSFFYSTSHGSELIPKEEDKLRRELRIFQGKVQNFYPFERWLHEAPWDANQDGLYGSVNSEFVFLGPGIWPFERIKPPERDQGKPWSLKQVAQTETYDRVGAEQERVDGRWCHVLEDNDGSDRLWIDVERGFSMVARETQSPISGKLAHRIELFGQREIAPGIWFPTWFQNIQYDHNARTPEGQKSVWRNARLDVVDVQVNNVDDAVFRWDAPPGTISELQDKGLTQVRPGGVELIDEMANWVNDRHHLQATQTDEQPRLWWLVMSLAGLIVVVGVEFARNQLAANNPGANRPVPETDK